MDLVKLKAEIAKPEYSNKSDEEIEKMLTIAAQSVDRETLDSGALVGAIVRSEFIALTQADKDYLLLLSSAQNVPITPTVKTELKAIFPVGSATRGNFNGLLKRTGNKAEELGLGGVPTTSQIADARRL